MSYSRTEGLSALWSSTLPSIILVANPSINLMVYETLKRRCERVGLPVGSGAIFAIGAVSKCVATVITYPLQVRNFQELFGVRGIQIRKPSPPEFPSKIYPEILQVSQLILSFKLVQSKMRHSHDGRSMISVLLYVVQNSGVSGLFRGLESKLLQTVFTSAVMFTAYEKIVEIIFSLLRADRKAKSVLEDE